MKGFLSRLCFSLLRSLRHHCAHGVVKILLPPDHSTEASVITPSIMPCSFSFQQMVTLAVMLTLAFTAMAAPAAEQDVGPCPVDPENLPSNTRQLTYFGERAAYSPDGTKIAFVSKSYGDAFEIDLKTKRITLLTHYPNAGYLRVQYLPNGDYFLIGSRTFVDEVTTRDTTEEMWILKQSELEPEALNQKIDEGVAISRKRNRIAWANIHENYPDQLIEGESAIYVADVVYQNGTPALANKREVLRDISPHCVLEPQDFRNDDTELIFTCYTPTSTSYGANVRGIDLNTGEVTIYRDVPGQYNEVEGIYPDGKHELVESGKDQTVPDGSGSIDLWRLRLEPNSTDFVRMTCFGEIPGGKASNPVVSPDGRSFAFQSARSGDAAGVGYGIFIRDLD